MHSDRSTAVSKKRKRSDGAPERERTSSIIRRSLALLAAIPEIPAASLHPLLSTLTDAYGAALSEEARDWEPPPAQPMSGEEDWSWELTTEQITRLSEEELAIWKDLLPCRHALRISGIKLHPSNWKTPVVDLREWEAHIPGRKGTPWEGGVYSLHVLFSPGASECTVPKLRFFVPLFHPNVYPSGTWAYNNHTETKYESSGKGRPPSEWIKTKQEDPERFAKLLQTIEKVLHEPDISHPAQSDAYTAAKNDFKGYEEQVRAQAKRWTPDPRTGLAGRPVVIHTL
ncbi:ubiquitin-conjugating enzyme/RWD-like protein [Mycena olivaceomarginata]|nr:ubiquitin-conjugating enzyme/RWD-like protein [Mycena olivaceomarginata]